MNTHKEYRTGLSEENEIRSIETSRMPFWVSRLTRGWLVAVFGLSLGASWLVGGGWQEPFILVLVVLAASYQIAFRYIHRISRKESAALNGSDSETSDKQLQVYGDSSELFELQDISTEFFEPYLVRFGLVRRTSVFAIWTIFAFAVGFVIRFKFSGSSFLSAIAVVSIMHLSNLGGLLFPSYYRIYPGRLETLVSGPFSEKTRRGRTVSLTDARIVCRLDKDYILITPSGEQEAWRICLKGLRDPHEFARKVFQGAMANPSSAKLPDDTLLG